MMSLIKFIICLSSTIHLDLANPKHLKTKPNSELCGISIVKLHKRSSFVAHANQASHSVCFSWELTLDRVA